MGRFSNKIYGFYRSENIINASLSTENSRLTFSERVYASANSCDRNCVKGTSGTGGCDNRSMREA